MSKDIGYVEPLSRHRSIMPIYGMTPVISQNVFIAPNASAIGEVLIGDNCSIWYGSVLKADNHPIR